MANYSLGELPDTGAMATLLQATHGTPSSLTAFVSRFEDDATRWCAVQTRDTSADGFFVYAVKSTKIYCRPICKARLARRANVRFFTLASEARDAGFRACKRCKPDEIGSMPEEKAVTKIKEFVRQGGEGGSLAQMARKSGLSKWHFHRVFKRTVGVTPVEYVRVRKRGNAFDLASAVNGQHSGETPSTRESSATGRGDSLDWLHDTESEGFDLETLDPLLKEAEGLGDVFAQECPQGKELGTGVSWTDFLNFPDDTNGLPHGSSFEEDLCQLEAS